MPSQLSRALDRPDGSRMRAVGEVLAATPAQQRDEVLRLLARYVADTDDQEVVGAVEVTFTEAPCEWHVAVQHFPELAELPVECRPFPSVTDVEGAIGRALSLQEGMQAPAILELLTSVRAPQNTTEERIVKRMFALLADAMSQSNAQTILEAVDAFHPDGGVATDTCAFYARVMPLPEVQARYAAEPHRTQLHERCDGNW